MNNIESKCKNCGSELEYNPSSGVLKCKYCGATYYLPKEDKDAKLIRSLTNSFHPSQFSKNVNYLKCNACGYTFFCANTSLQARCTNCGSEDVQKNKSDGFCADGIIPFKISKEQAQKQIVQYFSTHFAKKEIKEQAKNINNIYGVFVPVWNFIFDLKANYTANAVELKKDNNGVYYSIPFAVYGEDSKSIKSGDKSATTYENDNFLDLFNENDYKDIVPFNEQYAYGFVIDDIDKNITEVFSNLCNEEKNIFKKEISKKVCRKYKDVSDLNVSISEKDVYYNFTYVPLYVFSYKKNKQDVKIYVSGTTNKIVGQKKKNKHFSLFKIVKIIGTVAILAVLGYIFLK